MPLKIVVVCLVAFGIFGAVGCGEPAFRNFDTYVTPQPGDANYGCLDSAGKPHADWVSCKPFDGTDTCCYPFNTCEPNRKCAYQGNPYTLGAAQLTDRPGLSHAD